MDKKQNILNSKGFLLRTTPLKILLGITIIFFISLSYAQETIVETRSPTTTTTIVSGWNNPTYVYASDDLRAYTSAVGAEQEYSGYGFNIPSTATIQGVYVGVEAYTTTTGDILNVKIYNGTTWFIKTATDYDSETLQWLNFTSYTNWTPSMINNIKTRIYYSVEGGGDTCFSNNTYFLTTNLTHFIIKRVTELTPNDYLYCYNKNKGGYALCKISQVIKHEGNYEIMRIYFNLTPTIKNQKLNYKEFIELTPNHPIFNPKTGNRTEARELKVGDNLTHLYLNEMLNFTIDKIEYYNATEVYDVKVMEEFKDYYIFGIGLSDDMVKTLESLFGNNWNIISANDFPYVGLMFKQTYYVDWIAIKVNYTTPTPVIVNISIQPEFHLRGTEYFVGEIAKPFVQLSYNGSAITNATCYASVLYPNNSYLIQNQLMSNISSLGIYYINFSTKNLPEGLYIWFVNCSTSYGNIQGAGNINIHGLTFLNYTGNAYFWVFEKNKDLVTETILQNHDYCYDNETLAKNLTIQKCINDICYNYTKIEFITCEYGCSNDKCNPSPISGWIIILGIILFVVIILALAYKFL